MTRTALAILSTLILTAPAQAEVYTEIVDFQFIGASSTFMNGGGGVLDMSRACQETWPQARMCTSVEVMETVSLPTGE